MIRTEDFSDKENPMHKIDVLLSTCAWALYSIASVVTSYLPGQLIYKQDMIMGAEPDLNWSNIPRAKENKL